MKKQIVILGDSLSLPRNELTVEHTYPMILENLLESEYKIFNKSIRANDTSLQIKSLYGDLVGFNPDFVIIHLGIVDCAPRLFKRLERKVYSTINKVFPIIKLFSRHRYLLTKLFPKVYVDIQQFEKNYRFLLQEINKMNTNVIVIGIADSSEETKAKSYNYEKNILTYNSAIKSIIKEFNNVFYIDVFNYKDEEILLPDGIHLNKIGSRILANDILKGINHFER